MTDLRVPPSMGEYWGMEASGKWKARIDQVMRERGLTPASDAEFERKEAEIRAEQADRKARILLGRLDARYREAEPRWKESIEWVKNYVDSTRSKVERGRGLIVLGGIGVGKTWESAAIARILLTRFHVPVQFVDAPELMAALRPNAEGASDIGQFLAAPVLVLDDLGAERATEWVKEQMFRIANYRNVHCLPTIITSNLGGPELREIYGDRVIDRLSDGATLLRIKLTDGQRTYRKPAL